MVYVLVMVLCDTLQAQNHPATLSARSPRFHFVSPVRHAARACPKFPQPHPPCAHGDSPGTGSPARFPLPAVRRSLESPRATARRTAPDRNNAHRPATTPPTSPPGVQSASASQTPPPGRSTPALPRSYPRIASIALPLSWLPFTRLSWFRLRRVRVMEPDDL